MDHYAVMERDRFRTQGNAPERDGDTFAVVGLIPGVPPGRGPGLSPHGTVVVRFSDGTTSVVTAPEYLCLVPVS